MNTQRACSLQIQNKKKHVEQLTFHKRQNSNDLKSFSIQVASPFCRLWSQPNSIALVPDRIISNVGICLLYRIYEIIIINTVL